MSPLEQTLMHRRDFLKLSSGTTAALVLGFAWPLGCKENQVPEGDFVPNAYLEIRSDDTILVTMPRSEMGQKIYTALPMIVAEELEADWSRIKVVQGDLDRDTFGSQTTGGSASIRTQYDRLRLAGATAKTMLIMAAAQTWNVPVAECHAELSQVIHTSSRRSLSYGELAGLAATLPRPSDVVLKDPREFKIIGQAYKSLDSLGKVDGSIIYGYDFKLPDMLIAAIARIPKLGGKLLDFDDSEALKVPGVIQVASVSAGVAVLARNSWAALQGRRKLKLNWDAGPNADLNSDTISQQLHEALKQPGSILRTEGSLADGRVNSTLEVDLTFEVPYLDHAPQEPNNCTAQIQAGLCQVWAPTQNPGAAFGAAKQVTGFADAQIRIHTLRMGGGFGRKLQSDFVRDAVEVALLTDQPVKVIRTRDEDIRNGFYRPTSVHHTRLGLNANGQPQYWQHHLAGPLKEASGVITGGADEFVYAMPSQHISYSGTDIPVPIGAWRSVAHTQNAFVHESMMDEAARRSGQDPLAFRRSLLQDNPRHLGVLDLVAQSCNWDTPLPPGRARGLAVHFSFHSWVAVVVEVSQPEGTGIRIDKITAAIDCGTVINPDGVRAQVEGGIVMGLTAALYGEITLKQGRVQQSNFHDYRLLTMAEMPLMDIHIVPSTEPPTGAGEPPVPPTPPALANAIAALTGKRITRLPIKDQLG